MLAAGGVLSKSQALWAGLVAHGRRRGLGLGQCGVPHDDPAGATPDRLRGRLQGVFIVVVAGGPRLGELLGGFVARRWGEGRTAVLGGLACVVAIVVLARLQPGFVRYDARHPTP